MEQKITRDHRDPLPLDLQMHLPVGIDCRHSLNGRQGRQPSPREGAGRLPCLLSLEPGLRGHDKIGHHGLVHPDLNRVAKTANHDGHTDHDRQAHHQGRHRHRVPARMARSLVCRNKPEAPPERHRPTLVARAPSQRLNTNRRKTGEGSQEADCREITKERQALDRTHQGTESCHQQQGKADPAKETGPQLIPDFIVSRRQGTDRHGPACIKTRPQGPQHRDQSPEQQTLRDGQKR